MFYSSWIYTILYNTLFHSNCMTEHCVYFIVHSHQFILIIFLFAFYFRACCTYLLFKNTTSPNILANNSYVFAVSPFLFLLFLSQFLSFDIFKSSYESSLMCRLYVFHWLKLLWFLIQTLNYRFVIHFNRSIQI